jgi:hypothetical protein
MRQKLQLYVHFVDFVHVTRNHVNRYGDYLTDLSALAATAGKTFMTTHGASEDGWI